MNLDPRRLVDGWLGRHEDRRLAVAGSQSFGPADPIRELYDRAEYDRYLKDLSWLRSAMACERWRDKTVLEIGFGAGTDLLSFARHGSITYGVELASRRIEVARDRFAYARQVCRLTRGDGNELPFRSETFDLVYLFDVLHDQADAARLLSEIRRVLEPGGEALIIEPSSTDPGGEDVGTVARRIFRTVSVHDFPYARVFRLRA